MLNDDPARYVREIAEWLRRTARPVHLIGIGGIGMAGLARLLAQQGFTVTGSDLLQNRQTEWLARHGVRIYHGHSAEHLAPGTAWAIRSTAVSVDHVEVTACQRRGIPIHQRGLVLAALTSTLPSIAVSGTHGKTTTTAMLAHVLEYAGLKPGYFVGGERTDQPVSDWGSRRVFVLEADESDGTLAAYQPETSIITNLEYDHMEHFASRGDLEECFRQFMQNTKKRIIYCRDDPAAGRIGQTFSNAASYGFSDGCDVRAMSFKEESMHSSFHLVHHGGKLGEMSIPLHGQHNVLNTLAAYCAVTEYGVSFEHFRTAMAEFKPVLRRFENCGVCRGATIISDYAHHPTELRAVIRMARTYQRHGRVLVVFQPHRYTRTLALKEEFATAFDGADALVLCPVYAASEAPIPGGTSSDLIGWLPRFPEGPAQLADTVAHAWTLIKPQLREGDLLLILGAGDVDGMARSMIHEPI